MLSPLSVKHGKTLCFNWQEEITEAIKGVTAQSVKITPQQGTHKKKHKELFPIAETEKKRYPEKLPVGKHKKVVGERITFTVAFISKKLKAVHSSQFHVDIFGFRALLH